MTGRNSPEVLGPFWFHPQILCHAREMAAPEFWGCSQVTLQQLSLTPYASSCRFLGAGAVPRSLPPSCHLRPRASRCCCATSNGIPGRSKGKENFLMLQQQTAALLDHQKVIFVKASCPFLCKPAARARLSIHISCRDCSRGDKPEQHVLHPPLAKQQLWFSFPHQENRRGSTELIALS